ncbi:MAG: class I SAM-dependent methyltransferase [bacterium]|nr:MAG: class I SAM-dependent methyltransferase [bacterium]
MQIFKFSILIVIYIIINRVDSQNIPTESTLDYHVEKFLAQQQTKWRDMNIPAADGKILFDLIIQNKYTRALEIGTSTGHSAIWMAWALSKTGGKLITIEINENRYRKALHNFKEAGVDSFIDARLGDAHELVPGLEGPFDFVFLDADKEWYLQYLKWLIPKMNPKGRFTAHNVLNTYMSGIPEFLDYLNKNKELETLILTSSSSGISVSYFKEK